MIPNIEVTIISSMLHNCIINNVLILHKTWPTSVNHSKKEILTITSLNRIEEYLIHLTRTHLDLSTTNEGDMGVIKKNMIIKIRLMIRGKLGQEHLLPHSTISTNMNLIWCHRISLKFLAEFHMGSSKELLKIMRQELGIQILGNLTKARKRVARRSIWILKMTRFQSKWKENKM